MEPGSAEVTSEIHSTSKLRIKGVVPRFKIFQPALLAVLFWGHKSGEMLGLLDPAPYWTRAKN